MKRQSFSSFVPFSGFYCSFHSDLIDRTEERMFYDYDEQEFYQNLADMFYSNVNYRQVFEEYAKIYVDILRDLTGLKSLTFEELSSPKEYNFSTDRIFVSISREDVAKMLVNVRQELKTQIQELFTSRSGFISFYSNQLSDWPKIDEWDHNQIGSILTAYLKKKHSDIEEEILEILYGDGSVDSFLYDAANHIGKSAVDVAYLKSRMKEEQTV